MSVRLERDPAKKNIAGVCAGLADYLQVNVAWVRAFFVISALLWGFGLLAYIVLLIVMPLPGRPAPAGDLGGVGAELSDAMNTASAKLQQALGPAADTDRRRANAGLLLVAVGFVFLLSNLGVFRGLEGRVLLPIVVIAIGIWLLMRRAR